MKQTGGSSRSPFKVFSHVRKAKTILASTLCSPTDCPEFYLCAPFPYSIDSMHPMSQTPSHLIRFTYPYRTILCPYGHYTPYLHYVPYGHYTPCLLYVPYLPYCLFASIQFQFRKSFIGWKNNTIFLARAN